MSHKYPAKHEQVRTMRRDCGYVSFSTQAPLSPGGYTAVCCTELLIGALVTLPPLLIAFIDGIFQRTLFFSGWLGTTAGGNSSPVVHGNTNVSTCSCITSKHSNNFEMGAAVWCVRIRRGRTQQVLAASSRGSCAGSFHLILVPLSKDHHFTPLATEIASPVPQPDRSSPPLDRKAKAIPR